MMLKYAVGDVVAKRNGAGFWGIIVSIYDIGTIQGKAPSWRYDVMAIRKEFFGTVHIMSTEQIHPCSIEVDDPDYPVLIDIQRRMGLAV